MKITLIFHSYSGITRGIAENVQAACGADIVEVRPKKEYSTLTAYTVGCLRARNCEKDPIVPETVDVSGSDLIVIGTPVWAFKATPAVNGAVAALAGCSGKKAVIFATCGGKAGETLPILKKSLEEKGVRVLGEVLFTKQDVNDQAKIGELVAAVKAAAAAP